MSGAKAGWRGKSVQPDLAARGVVAHEKVSPPRLYQFCQSFNLTWMRLCWFPAGSVLLVRG